MLYKDKGYGLDGFLVHPTQKIRLADDRFSKPMLQHGD